MEFEYYVYRSEKDATKHGIDFIGAGNTYADRQQNAMYSEMR